MTGVDRLWVYRVHRMGQAFSGVIADVMVLPREPETDAEWEWMRDHVAVRLTPSGFVMVDGGEG